jgi:lipopolysaccharide transport system ATP-binding protein
MDATVIRVEKLSKMYRIGAKESQPQTLIETLRRATASPFDYLRRTLRAPREEEIFWALRDVSFEVKHGEVVGIIGRNGAGKSTLLKILSRITEPTSGRAVIKGRVGSLLEVGTGFHPELTGRENIFLNGTIMGMSGDEIRRKFDEIVDFSGVEKFIDTPVKHYSSGMSVRLAFAVSAHLEPDILIVDEVLAVGDAEFQKKCLGKMKNVSKGEGRTVLFVSHNMAAIRNLCENTIVLKDARVAFFGATADAVSLYINTTKKEKNDRVLKENTLRKGTGELRFTRYAIEDKNSNNISCVVSGEGCRIVLFYETHAPVTAINVGIAIFNSDGIRLSSLAASLLNKSFSKIPNIGKFVFTIPKLSLNEGEYSILIDANTCDSVLDRIEDAFLLNVTRGDFWGTGKMSTSNNPLLLDFDVTVEPI